MTAANASDGVWVVGDSPAVAGVAIQIYSYDRAYYGEPKPDFPFIALDPPFDGRSFLWLNGNGFRRITLPPAAAPGMWAIKAVPA